MVSVGSAALCIPTHANGEILQNRREVTLECLGDKPGSRWLDGRTKDGTVGLVRRVCIKTLTGTKWRVSVAGNGIVRLQCRGNIDGPRWLDGRTKDGTVGLAPNTSPPFTGTSWQVFEVGPNVVTLKCLGTLEGNRWLDGRTLDGTVGLAPNTNPPFTGTRWRVNSYPVCIDEPCPDCVG